MSPVFGAWRSSLWRYLCAASFLIVAFRTTSVSAQDGEEAAGATPHSLSQTFDAAGRDFAAGQLDEAIAGYERLLDAGVVDADVYYNLGTALAKAGRFGEATLQFERSLYLAPGEADASANLATTREVLAERLTERHGEVELGQSRGLGEALVHDLSEGLLTSLLLVFWAVAFLALMVVRLQKGRVRLGALVTALLSFLFAAVFGFLVASKLGTLEEGRPAVITATEGVLREGPDPRAIRRGDVYEGERADILRSDGEFVNVRLSGGRSGWLLSEYVGAVRPEPSP